MKKYRVTWEIEVDAENADGAALEALDCIINGTARVFTATDGPGNSKEVDLMEYGNGGARLPAQESTQEEGICPECGAELELEPEESTGDGEAESNWTCPDCGAAGVQVREAVFVRHDRIETEEQAAAIAKAALYPAPRTEYSPSGIMAFIAIGAGSGKWGPQISREEAERLLAPEDGEDSDDYGFTIYCKEASDRPGLWAGIESGDLEDGKLPEDWETFEIMFPPAPHEFER